MWLAPAQVRRTQPGLEPIDSGFLCYLADLLAHAIVSERPSPAIGASYFPAPTSGGQPLHLDRPVPPTPHVPHPEPCRQVPRRGFPCHVSVPPHISAGSNFEGPSSSDLPQQQQQYLGQVPTSPGGQRAAHRPPGSGVH